MFLLIALNCFKQSNRSMSDFFDWDFRCNFGKCFSTMTPCIHLFPQICSQFNYSLRIWTAISKTLLNRRLIFTDHFKSTIRNLNCAFIKIICFDLAFWIGYSKTLPWISEKTLKIRSRSSHLVPSYFSYVS